MSTAHIDTLPRTIRLGFSRIGYELKVYFRQGDSVFFTFLFPILMLSVFAVAFSNAGNIGQNPDGTGGISWAAFYLPGATAPPARAHPLRRSRRSDQCR